MIMTVIAVGLGYLFFLGVIAVFMAGATILMNSPKEAAAKELATRYKN